jgi:phosphatidate cytidylyltransferase
VLIAVVVTTIWWGPPWVTLLLACVAAGLAAFELTALCTRPGAPSVWLSSLSRRLLFVVPAPLVCAAFARLAPIGPSYNLEVVLMILMVVAGSLSLASGRFTLLFPGLLPFMVVSYIGLPLGALSQIQYLYGPRALSVLFVLVVVSDSAQYYTGRAFGRRKLAPSISPAKSVEGAVGGLVASALVGAFLGPLWIAGVTAAVGAALGLVLGALGMIGDLFESRLKRAAGVKDSSALIPGHGGILDRIDSWLFAAPIYYVFLRYIA